MATIITVAGKINDLYFQKASNIAYALEAKHPAEIKVECLQFFETQWDQFIKKTANDLKGVFYEHDESNALVYLNGAQYIGDADAFAQWALYNYQLLDKDGLIYYEKLAKEAYAKAINNSETKAYAKMTVSHSGVKGDVIFELFQDVAPITCRNFISFCKKEQQGYKGSLIHRVVPGMYIQGGRIQDHKQNEFTDESFHIKHTVAGLLGMCKRNQQKHTNDSQFYITTGAPLSFLDNENVVFGRVISGMGFLKSIEQLERINEKPATQVQIESCGVYTA
jgi:cyclophilin family peptidyl-prolyl cis-trans isomerase